MKKVFSSFLLGFALVILAGCSVDNHYDSEGKSPGEVVSSVTKLTVEKSNKYIPTLVIVMNWNNETELGNDLLWHDKLFGSSSNTDNSVNKWYGDNTNNNITLVPVNESYGIPNDGVVMVDMRQNHYNQDNDKLFRDTYVTQALAFADTSVDFAIYDKDNNGYISSKEMQIIFIVAGGELAYGGKSANSMWAHSWNYDGSVAAPTVDGNKKVLFNSSDKTKAGYYAAFGAEHRPSNGPAHKATIGIMAHEIGHSLYDLVDFYDTGSGSGLGDYDIMSDGIWGQQSENVQPGATPVQFSAYNKLATSQNVVESNTSGENVTLKCSANEFIKLPTAKPKEYFLVECRDTAKSSSDSAFNFFDSRFTKNKLVAIAYHIDEEKLDLPSTQNALVNSEDGPQTASHHYMDSVVERNSKPLMTDRAGLPIDFGDMYTEGYVMDKTKLKSYAGDPGFYVEVMSADYSQRTMSFRISK